MKIIIVGGGLGGLTAALHLHQAGFECEVFESAPEIQPLGVGINLLPHAVRELTDLGLGEQLAAAGVATAELAYYSKRGQEIWREPRGLSAGYRWPQYSIHRGRFQNILLAEVLRRLGPDRVHTGHALASFAADESGVTARFANGREFRGGLLIAADGIHSVVRRTFYPNETEPKYCGRVLWRAVTEAPPFLTGRSMIMAGYANCKFVAYPIREAAPDTGRALINWVADVYLGENHKPAPRDWDRRVDSRIVRAHFEDWRFDWLDVPTLIDGADAIYEYPLIDRNPLPRWSFGRVTLLGDAAHPMYPIGSNGASQAILDAAALAGALKGNAIDMVTNPERALEAYEAERRGKTAAVVLSNRLQGPEIVMQMVEDRNGAERPSEVIAWEELEEVARRYRATAGFEPERLTATARGNDV